MSVISHYAYGGHARLSYGWTNPNEAAAVIACLAPLVWAFADRSHKRELRWVVRGLEIVVLVGLSLTYSRGGALGWLAALIFHHFARDAASRAASLRWFAVRVGIFACALVVTGLGARFATVAAGDDSAGNRLLLWSGGLKLLAASPWRGWGQSASGSAFMQWVQGTSATAFYHGMVNGFLSAAVDFGAGGLFLLCLLLLYPIIVGTSSVRRPELTPGESAGLAAAAGLIAFAVANLFSSLWMFPAVSWAALLLLAVIMWSRRATAFTVSPFLLSVTCSALLVGVSLAVADRVDHAAEWHLVRLANGEIELSRRSSDRGTRLHVVPDGRVLGSVFGREIRAAVEERSDIARIRVTPPGIQPTFANGELRVVIGARVRDVGPDALVDASIVFPAAAPPNPPVKKLPKRVLLPELDQIGHTDEWRRWSAAAGVPVATIPLTGQTLRGRFGELLSDHLLQEGSPP